jgi:trans-aconitate 2-methyltransferase
VRRVVDLGCGPGNSTAVLAARFPEATTVVGVDNAATMLQQAAAAHPHTPWTWEEADVAAWVARARDRPPFDVVFSNATLHWLPDHAALLPALWATVAPGGVLAVQMPRNFDAPSHTLMAATAADSPHAALLAGAREESGVHPPPFYYDILTQAVVPAAAADAVALWETEYVHVLPDADAVVSWMRGTGLRPYLARLPDTAAQAAFVQEYTRRIARAYPPRPDGRVLFPFRRLFFVARKPLHA